jgi:biopolymer transport protein ExbD
MARSVINESIVDTDEPMSQINVTSLVDVMFCLLIMFMVATPLMGPEGVEVELPAARGEPISEEEFLYSVISIDAKGDVFLGSLPLARDPERMKQELSSNVKLKEHGMAFIQGDQNVSFERIVDVLVALKAAEISQVGFVTDPNLKRIAEAK